MSKKYYAIRYLGGNRTCTSGQPNEKTGRYNIAANIAVFKNCAERDKWVDNEKRSAPTGLGGGERISATKKQCRDHCLGMTISEFNEMLEYSIEAE